MFLDLKVRTTFSLKIVLFFLFTSLALTFLVNQAQAAVVLDVTPGGGTYNSIQKAISVAPITTDTVKIRVAEGRYVESVSILSAKDITIEGGWNSTFTNRDTERATIVNASSFGSAINIMFGSTVMIDGLTATHGNSSGIRVTDSTVTVRNSKIGRNQSVFRGGGVYAAHSRLMIEDSLVSENSVVGSSGNTDGTIGNLLSNDNEVYTSETLGSQETDAAPGGGGYGGGGIYAYQTHLTVRNSTIGDNYDNANANLGPLPPPNSGGGIHLSYSEAIVEDSKILNNLAMSIFGSANGGGIYSAASDLSLANTIVAGNYAASEGGGLYFTNGSGMTQVDPPTLTLEISGVLGSTPNDLTIVNSTFANNAANAGLLHAFAGIGDAVEIENDARILGAFPGGGGGARIFTDTSTSTVSILNSILWGNRSTSGTAPFSNTNDLSLSRGSSTTVDISYSDIGVATGHPFAGAGNISTNPLFVDSNDNHLYDASTANYHLKKFSPAIDSGTGVGAPATDIDGVTRPKGAQVDMGVYEEPYNYDTKAPKLTINTPKHSITQSKNHKFRVRWGVTDPALSSGDLKARIWVRRGGSSTWRLWQDWTSNRSRVFNGRRRKTYFFKGEAKDAAGNMSGTTRQHSTVVPADTFLTDHGITTSMGMNFFKNSSKFKKNYYVSTVRSTKRGSFVVYRFKAKKFTLWATKGPRNGKAKVYIDGSFSRKINTNRATAKHRVMVYKKNFARVKYHTIKIVNVGNGGKKRLDLDALGVYLP